jgi:hypothetical protein
MDIPKMDYSIEKLNEVAELANENSDRPFIDWHRVRMPSSQFHLDPMRLHSPPFCTQTADH